PAGCRCGDGPGTDCTRSAAGTERINRRAPQTGQDPLLDARRSPGSRTAGNASARLPDEQTTGSVRDEGGGRWGHHDAAALAGLPRRKGDSKAAVGQGAVGRGRPNRLVVGEPRPAAPAGPVPGSRLGRYRGAAGPWEPGGWAPAGQRGATAAR